MSEEFEDLSSISEHPDAFFHNVTMLLSKMQERLLDVTKTTEIEIKIKSVKGWKTLLEILLFFLFFL